MPHNSVDLGIVLYVDTQRYYAYNLEMIQRKNEKKNVTHYSWFLFNKKARLNEEAAGVV